MSLSGSLPRRYARALIQLAQEENAIDRFSNELSSLVRALKESPDNLEILSTDLIDSSQRIAALQEITSKGGYHDIIKSFLIFLLKKDRFSILPEIAREYENFRDEIIGIVRVKVTSSKTIEPLVYQK